MADPVKLASKFVSALLEAPEKERERALAMVRGAFPIEPEPPEERARRLARDRKRRQRDRVTENVTLQRDHGVTESGTRAGPKRDQNGTEAGHVTLQRDQSVTLGGESLSLDLPQDSPSRQQIRESHVTEAPRANEEPLFPMPEDWELDEETRAAAMMAGLKDPAAAWAAFRAENLDKPPRSRRTWLAKFRDQWVPRSKKYEAKDAAKGTKPTPLRQPVAAVRAWQAGEEWRGAK